MIAGAAPLSEIATWWTWDPLVLGLLFATTALYARGALVLRARAAPRRESLAFAAGQVAIVVALVSPLDRMSDLAFAPHMTQHEILMLAAAPLLVLARPLVVF